MTAAKTRLSKSLRAFCNFFERKQVNFPGIEFLGTEPTFRKRKKKLSCCIYVLRETSLEGISRCSRAVTVKKCTKKCSARTELLFCLCKPIAFLTSSLPLSSSLLKLPINSKKLYYKLLNRIERFSYDLEKWFP